MPGVNQRVTVLRSGHPPVPSRVEDEAGGSFVIAAPNIALVDGEHIVVSWESDDGWYSLESTVMHVDEASRLPTVSVVPSGSISHHDDRRSDVRVNAEVALELRPVLARVIKPGRTLTTSTIEVGGRAVRFSTSAPFAPGDVMEASLKMGDHHEPILTRLKVIRVDSATNSWRQVVTAVYDEMLRSDRARLISWIEAQLASATEPLTAPIDV